MKFGTKEFRKPTPKIMKRVGASLLSVSVFVSSYAFYNSHEYIGVIGLGSGILGTIISNMFSNEKD